ncbi:MAG: hypothetical protein VYB30_04350 [Candidatus Thermoplasmatota archaeon]|nr:hypothetical protein [Candidatus Thermoplasmatota archaeon]
MFGEWILRELCWFFVVGPGVEAAKQRKQQETKFVSINNNCSIDGCNAMRYEESIYCLRHKPNKESKEETQQEENWWGDEN